MRRVVDINHDAHEISLDENIKLAEERGLGAEEIGARFGVSAIVVRQCMKLAAVSLSFSQNTSTKN